MMIVMPLMLLLLLLMMMTTMMMVVAIMPIEDGVFIAAPVHLRLSLAVELASGSPALLCH